MSETATVMYDKAHLMSTPSSTSIKIMDLKKGDVITIEEKTSKLWWKITYEDYTGYMKTKYLKSENGNVDYIMISIPRDAAVELYEALKFSLE